jgi:glycerophosphoryl diester phosphodiesterase
VIEVRRGDGRLTRIGHRGAAALEPENTLRSFRRAIELGVDLVEFDVLDLDDGSLVVAHSDDLHEVSHGAAVGRVRTLPLAGLREQVPELPTLDEALAFFRDEATATGLHVDLKTRRVEDVAEALGSHGLVERAYVSTAVVGSLRALAALEPRLMRVLTYPDDRRGLARRRAAAPFVPLAVAALRRALPSRIAGLLAAAHASAAALHFDVVSAAVVARAHEAGAAVIVWTVDDADVLATLKRAGVDAVVTNDPRIFGATLQP